MALDPKELNKLEEAFAALERSRKRVEHLIDRPVLHNDGEPEPGCVSVRDERATSRAQP